MLRSDGAGGLARGESGTGVGGRMRLTLGGIRLIPMLLGGQESGLSGTAWLGFVGNVWITIGCIFSGVDAFLAVKLRGELTDN